MLERVLELRVDRVHAEEREGLERLKAACGRGLRPMMREHAVREREPALLRELRRTVRGEDLQPELHVAKHPPLVTELDGGGVHKLADLAQIVHDRGGDQQIPIQARMELAELPAELRDGDGVLEQPAQIRVVAAAGAGRAAQRGAELLIAKHGAQEAAEARIMHLGREVFEEPFELVEIAVRRRQKLLGVDALSARELLHIQLEGVAEPFHAPPDAHRVTRRKPCRDGVGIAKHPAGDRAGAVPQLQREVGLAASTHLALGAHDREHAVDGLLLHEFGDRGAAGGAGRLGRRRGHRGSCSVNDVEALRLDHLPEGLRAPILVCSFRGWSDAGQSSTIALAAIGRQLETETFGSYDPETLYDFQAARPFIVVRDGVVRDLRWPRLEYRAARAPRAPRDLITLMGPEPSTRWNGFAESVAHVAQQTGAQMIVTLGSLMGEVPHTQPAPLMAISSEESLLDRLDLHRPDYEGPTGLLGPIHIAAMRANIPVVGLWASVPHYVSAPNPNGALSLVRGVEKLSGITFDASALEEGARDFADRVSGAVAADPSVASWVERLEEAAASEQAEMADPEALPDGDVLAREFQRFLRQRGPEQE